jgi:hypothetical protein
MLFLVRSCSTCPTRRFENCRPRPNGRFLVIHLSPAMSDMEHKADEKPDRLAGGERRGPLLHGILIEHGRGGASAGTMRLRLKPRGRPLPGCAVEHGACVGRCDEVAAAARHGFGVFGNEMKGQVFRFGPKA